MPEQGFQWKLETWQGFRETVVAARLLSALRHPGHFVMPRVSILALSGRDPHPGVPWSGAAPSQLGVCFELAPDIRRKVAADFSRPSSSHFHDG